MRINVAVPEAEVSKPILDAALEATTRVNESLIEKEGLPLWDEALASGVQWKPEPPGQEHFDHAGIVLGRMAGDCDDLAPYHAASLRITGEDPDARAVVKRSGARKWHAIVKRGDGSYDDPSKDAGMAPGIKPWGVSGIVRPIPTPSEVGTYYELPRLKMRPIFGRGSSDIEAWQARADLPWNWKPGKSPTDIAMASLHRSPTASQAIVGALMGAVEIADHSSVVGAETVNIAEAVAWALEGADYEEICGEFGEDIADETVVVVNGIFKKMGRGLKKIGRPLIKAVTSKAGRALISQIPGVGPSAATALEFAGPVLNEMSKPGKKKKRGRKKAVKVRPFGNAPKRPKSRRGMKKGLIYLPA